mgnify:CR=1 FL=1|jgi:hypothetical protein|tara:strand:- start:778 stop:1161 length:384 start_codon:yes stop_codon:yes gene_type:complete
MSKSKLVKKLDAIFSKYIRWYYADSNGYVSCYTCGSTKPVSEMQNGHFISRRKYAIRWHTDNCKPQCQKCNIWEQGQQFIFGNKLKAEIGEDKFNELIQLSNTTVKRTKQDYEDMIKYYKDELNKLM